MFSHASRLTIAAVLIALPLFATATQNIVDPMRPATQVRQAETAAGPQWRVTGILISADRRLATINDRLVGIGEKVDGARVKAIHGDMVELDVGGRSVYLKPVTRSLRRVK